MPRPIRLVGQRSDLRDPVPDDVRVEPLLCHRSRSPGSARSTAATTLFWQQLPRCVLSPRALQGARSHFGGRRSTRSGLRPGAWVRILAQREFRWPAGAGAVTTPPGWDRWLPRSTQVLGGERRRTKGGRARPRRGPVVMSESRVFVVEQLRRRRAALGGPISRGHRGPCSGCHFPPGQGSQTVSTRLRPGADGPDCGGSP